MEAYLHARWPSRPAWSPDGRYVSFLWTDWVGQDLYVVPAAGGAPIPLTQGKGFVGGSTWNSSGGFGAWSPDSRHVVYSLDGDLQLTAVPEATTTRLTETEESEDGARFSPDGTRLAFVRGGNVFVMLMKDRAITPADARRTLRRAELVSGREMDCLLDLGGLAADDGEPRLLGAADRVSRRPRESARRRRSYQPDGGAVRLLEPSAANEGVVNWAPDGARLLIERTSIDVKDRTLLLCAASTAACQPVYTQRDEKYLASNDQVAAFSPDGQSILFTSDQDGWNHAVRDAGRRRRSTPGHERRVRGQLPVVESRRPADLLLVLGSRSRTAADLQCRGKRRHTLAPDHGGRDAYDADRVGARRDRVHSYRPEAAARRVGARDQRRRQAAPAHRVDDAGAQGVRMADAADRHVTRARAARRSRRSCSCRAASTAAASIRRSCTCTRRRSTRRCSSAPARTRTMWAGTAGTSAWLTAGSSCSTSISAAATATGETSGRGIISTSASATRRM